MLTALKVRLYPNKEQQIDLAKNFGCCRMVWNYYLNKTNTQYQETGKGMSYCDIAKDLTQLKKQENFLGYKLNRVGGILVEVDRFFPSTKLCNHCKFKNDFLTLKDREWTCPECGTHHDRDGNATKNLREEGIRILSTNTVGHTEFKAWGEDVSLVSNSARKLSSMKQESPVIATA